ncbi:creatininase family protein [Saccharibacter floricola]|uniref:Creatininase n=1 Tax=Saccharibacter floricola DSM 15669 TaxID=1123227 RepID=A0ABQ0NYZ0_9PROT|nr:creatininase family protein [Saccharibacter floricola]GBQ06499.1 creatininase [Saccharibacter floricola DSM 15669]
MQASDTGRDVKRAQADSIILLSAFLVMIIMLGGGARSLAAERSFAPLSPQPTCSALAGEVELACQSWTEIAAAQKAGTRTAIIPIGGTEQSGPYIAVGKHNVRAQLLADLIAHQLGHTIVAPVMAYVPEGSTTPRRSHMRFPGTLSLPPDIFEAVVRGAAESLRVQGFQTIVLLGDHGGYQRALAHVAATLNAAWKHQGAQVLFVHNYYQVIPTRYAELLRKRGYGNAVGQHAELSDTSLMLAVDPSLVRQEALRHAAQPHSADGVYGGDPRQATAELGRLGTDLQVQAAVEAISSFNRSHL